MTSTDTALETKTIVLGDDAPLAAASSILSVEITKGPGPLPAGVFDQSPRVIATMDDGATVELFSFYASERTFMRDEFVGLTVDAARRLKFAPGHEPSDLARRSRGQTSDAQRSSDPGCDVRDGTMSARSPLHGFVSRCIAVVSGREMAANRKTAATILRIGCKALVDKVTGAGLVKGVLR